MSAYLVNRAGQELGSFTLTQIKAGLAKGELQGTDWGWQDGMADWKPLSTLVGSTLAPLPAASAPMVREPNPPTINPYASPAGRVAQPLGSSPLTGGYVPAETVDELARTKPWVRLISVLMTIGCVLVLGSLLVNVLSLATLSSKFGSSLGGAEIGLIFGALVFMGITAVLIVYPTVKLSKYATNIGRLVESKNFLDLTAALREQRRFWRFYGILAVLYLCLIGCVVLLVLLGAGVGSLR